MINLAEARRSLKGEQESKGKAGIDTDAAK